MNSKEFEILNAKMDMIFDMVTSMRQNIDEDKQAKRVEELKRKAQDTQQELIWANDARDSIDRYYRDVNDNYYHIERNVNDRYKRDDLRRFYPEERVNYEDYLPKEEKI